MKVFGQLGTAFLIAAIGGVVLAVLGLVADVDVLALVGGILAVTFGVLGAVFTIVQHRLFASPAMIDRVTNSGLPTLGTVAAVGGTYGRVNANPIMKLTMAVANHQVVVRTVVPIEHLPDVIVGARLPMLTDPDGSEVAIIDWARVPPPRLN
jgi:hypothetical protein